MNINQVVALYQDGSVIVGTLKNLFPNVSFPASGPNADWISDNNVYVIKTKPFNNMQKSTLVDPYYEDGSVYTNTVRDKTEQELSDEVAAEFAEAKAAKVSSVINMYVSKVASGVEYQGTTYQIDETAQSNMVATQSRFNKGTPNSHGGYWRNRDNVKVVMTDAEVQELFDAAFSYKAELIRNLHDLKDAIAGATTQEELSGIDITAGWPNNGV